jgi:large subunit ribosomal protein L21
MYAIIEAAGKQIRVSSGDQIKIDNIEGGLNSEIILDKVLMIAEQDKTTYGKPYIEGASVKAEIVGQGKMPKVLVFGPAPKKACRRLKGHRQPFKTLKIKEIIGG